MNVPKSVSILGCGWLGLPLGKQLLGLGYAVKGSTTSLSKFPVLQNAGIKPFLIHVNADKQTKANFDEFLQSDILVIAVPPGRTEEKRQSYLDLFNYLAEIIPQTAVQKIILISSTSVYGEPNAAVDEDTIAQPSETSGLLLKRMEEKVEAFNVSSCIVRMAGLIGPQRHPGRFFAGKQHIPNGQAPVNLIHLDDAVQVLIEIIQKQVSGIVNACAPSHPSRAEFYTLATQMCGLELPHFTDDLHLWKVVKCNFLDQSNFPFKHPDLLNAHLLKNI
ncbi:MAG: NAD-dependent epimerase/dehydratase family protein [Sphingobacteriaceae bacterium]